ncbi:UPF0149 family protein [Simiduia aestuariiviva]|uniref:YecA family protein n=1 Tax=Simiduia aestuariiviva TaxID=1510459 RepID=A0A839ULR6_9GAMM|nr:uncharacterized protein [Simiduia aestuariiviva]
MLNENLTDADLAFIDDMLEKYGCDDSIGNFSELDGFLTALASGPDMLLPSQWMPWIWGDEEDQPTWQYEHEATQFFEILINAMNRNSTALMDKPSEFQPMFESIAGTEEGGDQWFLAPWCLGYLRAVFISDWPDLPEDFDHWLALIEQQSFQQHAEELAAQDEDAQAEMAGELTIAALMLHRYWLEQRLPVDSPTETLRRGPKVGRNDPCPCGSGKKFKQCCLH